GRDRERLGGLGLREPEEVAGADHLALLVTQATERRVELYTRLAGEDRRFRRRLRLVAWRRDASTERETGPPIRRAPAVACLVGDDAQQPRPDRRSGTEACQRAIRLDERILDSIGSIGLRGDEICGAHGEILVAPDERLVRGDIT